MLGFYVRRGVSAFRGSAGPGAWSVVPTHTYTLCLWKTMTTNQQSVGLAHPGPSRAYGAMAIGTTGVTRFQRQAISKTGKIGAGREIRGIVWHNHRMIISGHGK